MGSYAGTCGISHLPIEAGEPVRFVLITGVSWSMDKPYREQGWQHPPKDAPWEVQREKRYTHWRNGWWTQHFEGDVFFPRTIPVRATYDSYGGVENVDWSSLPAQAMRDQFQLDLVEYQGDVGGIPPRVAKEMPLSDLLRAVIDDAVTVRSSIFDSKDSKLKEKWTTRLWRWLRRQPAPIEEVHPHVPVGLWMVRNDVYEALINCRIAAPWDPPIEPNRYDRHVEEFIDELKEEAEAAARRRELDTDVEELADALDLLKQIKRISAEMSPFGKSPPFENGVGFYVQWLKEQVEAAVVDASSPEVRQMVVDLAEFSMFRTAMYCCRVGWMPRAHGPQFGWTDAHVAVANVVMQVDRHVKERAETP